MLSIKPGPLQAVNLYGRANGNVAQFISFLEKWVQASGVHQGNEENEECCRAPLPDPRPWPALLSHTIAGKLGEPVAVPDQP
jgi:hypothetical protein